MVRFLARGGQRVDVGVLAYVVLIVALRLSGKRTLAKMNAFDLVVTVALGSTLSTVLLSDGVTLAEGVVGLLVLIGAQLVVAWCAIRFTLLRRLVKSQPTMLLSHGEFRWQALKRQRVTAGEVRQAVRSQGIGDLDQVAAVVLETDGSFSVIPTAQAGAGGALTDVADTPSLQ